MKSIPYLAPTNNAEYDDANENTGDAENAENGVKRSIYLGERVFFGANIYDAVDLSGDRKMDLLFQIQ